MNASPLLRPSRWWHSLIARVVMLSVVLVLILLAAVYFLTGHYYQQVVQTMERQAAEVANRVQVHLEEQLAAAEQSLEEMPDAFATPDEEVPIDLRLVDSAATPNVIQPQIGDGSYYFIATQSFVLSNGSWVELTVRLDVDPQTELVRAFKNRYLLSLTLLFISTIGALIYVIASALRPLQDFSDSCAEISAGHLQEIEARSNTREIRALEDTFNRMVGSLREKETVEANLRQAQRLSAIGNLAAGVAHDIRNPLNAIKLLSGDALDRLEGRDDAPARQLETIRTEVHRLEEIVSGFLSLAKEEQLKPELQAVDPILEECVSLVRQEAAARHVDLSAELRARDVRLRLDPKHFRRAVINVLLNAVEACPDGARVRVFSRVAEDHCEIEIRDDGPGIPQDIRERVFDPYFTTKSTGTGLGLSITRGIVEEHGGAVTLSGAAGHGTQVVISIPIPAD